MRTWDWAARDDAVERAMKDLDTEGFATIPDVLSPREVEELRGCVAEVAEREQHSGQAWFSNGNQRVFNLLNRGVCFVDLIEHPVAVEFAERVLGPHPLLSSITANVAHPDNVPQLLHTDQQYITEPWTYAATLQVVWMLDAFTEENGGTRVIPRTHLLGRRPVTEDIRTVSITGPAGGIALLDGRVWHGTGVNTSQDQHRHGIFAYYCVPFLRQQENVFRSLDPEIRSGLSPRARALLGYDAWQGLGVVDGIPRHWMGRPSRTGPVNTDRIFPDDQGPL